MSQQAFQPDQIDALKELANIAMGRTAGALGQILGLEIQINIPNVQHLSRDALILLINDRIQDDSLTLTRQAFSDGLDGEAILLFKGDLGMDADSAEPVAEDDGVSSVRAAADERLLEITNIVAGAFIGSLMEPLGADLYFTPPTLLTAEKITKDIDRGWDTALVLDIVLETGDRTSSCVLIVVFPETSIQKIHAAIDCLLESV